MGKAIPITRLDHSAADLRHLAAKTKDAQVARRLPAPAELLDGKSRTEAATLSGMQRPGVRRGRLGSSLQRRGCGRIEFAL